MKLRIILGVARSGTSWLHAVLSQSATPMRSLKEPLYILDNILNLESPFCGDLVSAYELLLSLNTQKFKNHRRIIRNDSNYELCLIKEIHGLLQCRWLLQYFKDIKIVFLIRNPVYIVDSLLSIHKDLNYFKTPEQEVVGLCPLIKNVERQYIIKNKISAIKYIHKCFEKTHNFYPVNTMLVNYETLCISTIDIFKNIAKFLDLNWTTIQPFLNTTTKVNKGNAYSIYRISALQTTRSFKFLTEQEVKMCQFLN